MGLIGKLKATTSLSTGIGSDETDDVEPSTYRCIGKTYRVYTTSSRVNVLAASNGTQQLQRTIISFSLFVELPSLDTTSTSMYVYVLGHTYIYII